MEANRKEECDFIARFRDEPWHIYECWLSSADMVCWYVGRTNRKTREGNTVWFHRTFTEEEIKSPKVETS